MQHARAEGAGAAAEDGAQGVAVCVGEGCAVLRDEFGEAIANEIGEAQVCVSVGVHVHPCCASADGGSNNGAKVLTS